MMLCLLMPVVEQELDNPSRRTNPSKEHRVFPWGGGVALRRYAGVPTALGPTSPPAAG